MIKKLIEQRSTKVKELRGLLEKADGENRDLSEDELKQHDTLSSEIDGLDAQINRAEKQAEREKREKELDAPTSRALHGDGDTDTASRQNIEVGTNHETEKPFVSLGEQLRAVVNAAKDGPDRDVDQRLSTRAASGANESVPSDGGFLVQTDFAAEILKRSYETGQVASRCRRIPISATANGLKMNGIDETSRADGSRWGGIRAYWADEAATVTAAKPKFRQVELALNKLMGIFYATDEVLADTNVLGAIATEGFSEEIGFKLDDAIVNGDGAGKPAGIMDTAAMIEVAKETGQAADTIVMENIIKMWARMYGRSRQNAVWFISQDIEPQLAQLSLSVGTGGVPVYMPAGGLSGAPYSTLYGLPLVPIEQCQVVGDAGDIILADMSQYLLIDKGGVNAEQSMHVRFLYDEMTFRYTYRVDGQPLWASALTPFNAGDTQSPWVKLAARA